MSYSPKVAWDARYLMRACRSATLATQLDGQPHAALVTPATLPDASVVMLLSELSEHTRQLRLDPRCALLFTGLPATRNPQGAARLAIIGRAAPTHDAAMKERWLRLHPYAAFYAGFSDFVLWRVQLEQAHYVGGFGQAARLSAGDVPPDAAACSAIAHAELAIIDQCNAHQSNALDDIASATMPGVDGGWRMVVVDTDGCDLACGDLVHRVQWSGPVTNAGQVPLELARLADAARNQPAKSAHYPV